jgi:hypothetical protein
MHGKSEHRFPSLYPGSRHTFRHVHGFPVAVKAWITANLVAVEASADSGWVKAETYDGLI